VIHFADACIGREEREAVMAVLSSGRLTRGPWCDAADEALGGVTGQRCHVVSSGTAALHLAMLAAGVGPGDEVIVPATSFVASANAVLYCGAKPVFVDVDSRTWTIDHERSIAAVTPRTKAIVPVNLYGVPPAGFADWQAEHFAATGQRVVIIEDNAEGLGSLRSGVPAVGDMTCYSFYGSKTATSGEGGAVGWSDPLYGRRVSHLAGQAQTKERYVHDACGFNYRMTEIQAAVLREQLKKLPQFLAGRRQVFDLYLEHLPAGFRPQEAPKDCTPGLWAFAVKRFGMDAATVVRRLHQAGIETRPVFPPLPSHRHLRVYGSAMCGTATALHREGIVLPTHCNLTTADVKRVCFELTKAEA
jgi:perosamine synthetase